jgi:6-phosphogluconolactonase (cycloisomerase 2 family)
MANILDDGEILLVASRGTAPTHGLFKWAQAGASWRGTQLATVNQLSALARHPSLPVVYGTSGIGQDGSIHAWRITQGAAERIGEKPSDGAEPCHLVVDPAGRLLIVTNYTSSTLGIQNLAVDGGFDGPIELIRLKGGGGPDGFRQDDAHPHQAIFHDGTLFVIDLGADLVRAYTIDPAGRGAAALLPAGETVVPAGTGPRHAVVLPDGRLAISGELGSNLIVGRPGSPVTDWANVPSTTRTGPAKTSHLAHLPVRNYPGDLQRSLDGSTVYLANRGQDTISAFDVTGPLPRLLVERDVAAKWPQHMLVRPGRLLVAGNDSDKVMVLPLAGTVPGEPQELFACSGPGWLTPYRE